MAVSYNPIKLALRSVFSPRGYFFSKGDWIRSTGDVIQLINLQCEYGDKYYLNVAIWVRACGEPEKKQVQYGAYRFRIGAGIDPEFEELLYVFRNEKKILPEEWETRLRLLLETKAIPLLDSLTTVDQLRGAYLTGRIRNVAIVRDASLYLFGNETPPRPQGV